MAATRSMALASSTEVPPNFMTIMAAVHREVAIREDFVAEAYAQDSRLVLTATQSVHPR